MKASMFGLEGSSSRALPSMRSRTGARRVLPGCPHAQAKRPLHLAWTASRWERNVSITTSTAAPQPAAAASALPLAVPSGATAATAQPGAPSLPLQQQPQPPQQHSHAASAKAAPAPAPWARLRSPAHICASAAATASAPDQPGDLSLSAYMRLPVEQYYILDPSQISFVEANRFLLSVPRLHLLGAWLEPQVEVAVRLEEEEGGGGGGAVVLEAVRCRLRGSGAVESLRLDERFEMRFSTRLTWGCAPGGGGTVDGPAPVDGAGAAAGVGAQRGDGGGGGGGGLMARLQRVGGSGGGSEIRASSQLDVWCEVVPPFDLMPRQALEASCSAVLRGLVSTLLPLFLRQLAADYRRWASDAAYRAARASRSKPLTQLSEHAGAAGQ